MADFTCDALHERSQCAAEKADMLNRNKKNQVPPAESEEEVAKVLGRRRVEHKKWHEVEFNYLTTP